MTDEQILSVITNELSQSNITTSNEAALRLPLSYYLGRPNGTEIEGRSQLTSTDVADAIEWIMPQVMKSFTQNNEVVVFDPLHEEDELQAEIESEYVYDVIMKQNDGFVLIHQFVKDALMQRNGLLKVYYESTEEVNTYSYTGLSQDQLYMIIADKNTSILEQSVAAYTDETGAEQVLFDVKIAVTQQCPKIVIDPVAPENFRVNLQHNSISLDKARFTCHIDSKTVSDMREEGYSDSELEALARADLIRTSYRFNYQDETTLVPSTTEDDPNKLLEIGECYMFLDVNGDGISERIKITTAGVQPAVKVLRKEELDASPWVSTTGILMSHKFQGLSVYDRLKQIQDNKTALIRSIMDNIYLQNNQRTIVVNGQVTIDDLLVSRPGGIVRVNRLDAIAPLITPQIGEAAFSMMNYLDTVKAGRVGVSKDGNASPEAIGDRLGSQGYDRMMNAQEEVVGLMIRVICETGIKQLCYKVRDLVTKHIDTIQDFKFRGQWIKVNPSTWPRRTSSTVRVGTGTGDVKAKTMAIQQVQQLQSQILQLPGQSLVNPAKGYAAIDDFCKFTGLNGASKYFVNPNSQEGQQASQKAQQELMQNKQQGMQVQVQQMQMEAQLAQSAMMTAKAEQDKVTLQGQVAAIKHQAEMTKQSMEAQIETMKQQLEQAKAIEKSHKEMADLQFKYDEMAEKKQLELSKLEESRIQKEMDIAAAYQLAQLTKAEPESMQEDVQENNVEEPNTAIMGALADLKDTHLQTQAIIAAINKPKRIIRGADGRPEGIE
jgi:hypothetical protein